MPRRSQICLPPSRPRCGSWITVAAMTSCAACCAMPGFARRSRPDRAGVCDAAARQIRSRDLLRTLEHLPDPVGGMANIVECNAEGKPPPTLPDDALDQRALQ